MSALEVNVDRTEIVAGESISGEVVMLQDFPSCHGVDVAWERSGKRLGTTYVSKHRVHTGPVTAGMRFPFTLTFPMSAPFTYQGQEINVQWRAWASADVPLKIDPKAGHAVTVLPREVPADPQLIATLTDLPPKKKPEPMQPILQLLVWALFLVILVCCFPLVPILLIVYARKRLLDTRLADFEVALPERAFVVGEWVEPEVRFRLKRPIDVAKLTLDFRVFERWTTGSGNNRRTHRREIHHEQRVVLEDHVLGLTEARGVMPGGAYRGGGPSADRPEGPVFLWRVPFQLPMDGPPALGSSLNYELKADLDIRGWPDADKLVKVPTVAARLSGALPRPEERSFEETSGDVAAVPRGDSRDGVNTDISGGGVWSWIGLSTLGVMGLGVASFAYLEGVPYPLAGIVGFATVSAVVLCAGLVGFQRAVRS